MGSARVRSGAIPAAIRLTLIDIGGLIVADLFLNGWSIDKSTERFEKLATMVFQRRQLLNIPFLPRRLNILASQVAERFYPFSYVIRLLELLVSYFADGLYPPEHIEAALKQAFGTERSILDISHATTSGTLVGLPVATVNDKPSCRIFTNYNGAGERHNDQGEYMDLLSGLQFGSDQMSRLCHKARRRIWKGAIVGNVSEMSNTIEVRYY